MPSISRYLTNHLFTRVSYEKYTWQKRCSRNINYKREHHLLYFVAWTIVGYNGHFFIWCVPRAKVCAYVVRRRRGFRHIRYRCQYLRFVLYSGRRGLGTARARSSSILLCFRKAQEAGPRNHSNARSVILAMGCTVAMIRTRGAV